MKSTGVVRKIDELGRIVLPSELRKVFGIHEGDELEISVDGERVVLQKRHDVCVFCGAEGPSVEFKGRRVCGGCVGQIKRGNVELTIPEEVAVTR
jgi:transcriptional pleiotropic regulator of transition state genes